MIPFEVLYLKALYKKSVIGAQLAKQLLTNTNTRIHASTDYCPTPLIAMS
jgi:hypothetical protein